MEGRCEKTGGVGGQRASWWDSAVGGAGQTLSRSPSQSKWRFGPCQGLKAGANSAAARARINGHHTLVPHTSLVPPCPLFPEGWRCGLAVGCAE